MIHEMTIKAYPRKPEFGGGFNASIRRECNGEKIKGPGFANYEAARNWVITEAHRLMAGRNYRRASIRARVQGVVYTANIWAI